MDSGRVFDDAGDLTGIRVDYLDLIAMRHVQAMIGAVHGRVVPASCAADLDLVDDVKPFGGKGRWHQ